MTSATFVKRYPSPERATAARVHRDWLDSLESGVRLPALLGATPHVLAFEHLGNRHPTPDDLPALAEAIGRLHGAAYRTHLRGCELHRPFPAHRRLVVNDFVSPRRSALAEIDLPLEGLPVALYKDANIRNFLLTEHGAAVIDFDDLTLAPFGYDLAKTVVSAAMTYGRLSHRGIALALEVYNSQTTQASKAAVCTFQQLQRYAELHHKLTVRYLNRNDYRHSWETVRPWPEPKLSGIA